jgi:hypothetical protein
MNLIQLTTLKTRLGIPPEDTANDAVLAHIIELCGQVFEEFCGRKFEYQAEDTVTQPVDFGRFLWAKRLPVWSVGAVSYRVPGSSDWVTAAGGAAPHIGHSAVCLDWDIVRALPDDGEVRAVYAGGYLMPGAQAVEGVEYLPKTIELAAVEQCAFLFQNRNRLGFASAGGSAGGLQALIDTGVLPPGTSTTGSVWLKFNVQDLLPMVRGMLQPYRLCGL